MTWDFCSQPLLSCLAHLQMSRENSILALKEFVTIELTAVQMCRCGSLTVLHLYCVVCRLTAIHNQKQKLTSDRRLDISVITLISLMYHSCKMVQPVEAVQLFATTGP